jgi:hypothetical protein
MRAANRLETRLQDLQLLGSFVGKVVFDRAGNVQ